MLRFLFEQSSTPWLGTISLLLAVSSSNFSSLLTFERPFAEDGRLVLPEMTDDDDPGLDPAARCIAWRWAPIEAPWLIIVAAGDGSIAEPGWPPICWNLEADDWKSAAPPCCPIKIAACCADKPATPDALAAACRWAAATAAFWCSRTSMALAALSTERFTMAACCWWSPMAREEWEGSSPTVAFAASNWDQSVKLPKGPRWADAWSPPKKSVILPGWPGILFKLEWCNDPGKWSDAGEWWNLSWEAAIAWFTLRCANAAWCCRAATIIAELLVGGENDELEQFELTMGEAWTDGCDRISFVSRFADETLWTSDELDS